MLKLVCDSVKLKEFFLSFFFNLIKSFVYTEKKWCIQKYSHRKVEFAISHLSKSKQLFHNLYFYYFFIWEAFAVAIAFAYLFYWSKWNHFIIVFFKIFLFSNYFIVVFIIFFLVYSIVSCSSFIILIFYSNFNSLQRTQAFSNFFILIFQIKMWKRNDAEQYHQLR